MSIQLLREKIYLVLKEAYPAKMSASEIAKKINEEYDMNVSRKQVHNALRDFARKNKHFAIFPSIPQKGITYSVYLLDPPFCTSAERSIKKIELSPVDIDFDKS